MAINYIGGFATSYGPYAQGGIPTIAAPTNLRATATTSSTVSLAWDAAAGTYTLQRAPVANGVTGAFATVSNSLTAKSYQDSGRQFLTTYAYRVLVTVNGVASGYSAEYRATTAGGVVVTDYVPQQSDFNYVSYSKAANGGNVYNPFWELNFTTTANTLDLSQINEVSSKSAEFANISGVALWINGTKLGDYPVPAGSGAAVHTQTIALPGAAGSLRTGKIRSGYVQGGPDFNTALQGGILTKLTASPGISVAKLPNKANVAFVVGDSIASGFAARPSSASSAYLMLSRDNPALSTWDIIAHAWGSNQALASFSDSNGPAIVQAVYQATRGHSGRKAVFIALGTNDMLAGFNASDVAANIAKRCDEIHTLDTTIEIHLTTPIRALTSVIPASVQTAYSNAYNALGTNRSWLVLHNGQDAVVDSDYQPGDVHPTNIGNVHFATWLKSEVFDKVPTGGPVYGGLVPLAFEENNIIYSFITGTDGKQWYDARKKTATNGVYDGYFYGSQAIGGGSSGLLGKLVMFGSQNVSTGEIGGVYLGLSSFKPTTATGIEFGIEFSTVAAQARYKGTALGNAFAYPTGTSAIGSEIQVYPDKIVYAVAYSVNGNDTLQIIHTQAITVGFPLIPAAFLKNAATRVRFQALANVVNRVDTPTGPLADPNPATPPTTTPATGTINNALLIGAGRNNNWGARVANQFFPTPYYGGGVQTITYPQDWNGNALRINYFQAPSEAMQDVYVDGVKIGAFSCDGPLDNNGQVTPQTYTTGKLSGMTHNQFEFRYTRPDGGGQCYIDSIECITLP